MSYIHVQNIIGYLVLFSLFQTVKTDRSDVEEQKLQSEFTESVVKFVNTSGLTPSPFDIGIKPSMRNYYEFNESLKTTSRPTDVSEIKPQRKPRTVLNATIKYGIKCLSCFAEVSSSSWDCYSATSVPSKMCNDAEQCFVELNPKFIKRGCKLPGRVNRTFLCKCPLCNDKPSYDVSNYDYKKLDDWEYDNARLRRPNTGMDLMCKVCETKGTNPKSDKNCRYGKNADYMVCPHNQLCFTNIDDEIDFVSRGCTRPKRLNSIFFFCNYTRCNKEWYPNPDENRYLRARRIKLRSEISNTGSSSGSKTRITYFYLMCMIMSTLMYYYHSVFNFVV